MTSPFDTTADLPLNLKTDSPKPAHSPSKPPPVSALLQEALDTPLDRTSFESTRSTDSVFDAVPEGLTSLPPAHLADKASTSRPHQLARAADKSLIKQTSTDPTTTGMPLVRANAAPQLIRRLTKPTPVTAVKRDAPAAINVGLNLGHRRSSSTVSASSLAVDGEADVSPTRSKGKGRASFEQAAPPNGQAVGGQAERKNRKSFTFGKNSLDPDGQQGFGRLMDFRIGGQQLTTMVTTNPFARQMKEKQLERKEEEDVVPATPSRPRMRHRSSSMSEMDTPPRHLQRTISSLMAATNQGKDLESAYAKSTLAFPSSLPRSSSFASLSMPSKFGLPKPTLPSLPNLSIPGTSTMRNFTASAPADDKSMWRTWWEGAGLEDDQPDPKSKKAAHKHLLDEADKGDTMEEEEANIKEKYMTPKNPIIFCHGLLGFDYLGPASLPPLQISHWRGIREVLEANGAEVMVARVPATSSAEIRAEILKTAIEERYPGREVNLIGHSMGGLDGRYLISKLKPDKFKVISLTTVSTPHRGSSFADYFIENIIGRERLPSWLSVLDTLKLPNSGDGSAFAALCSESMRQFNEQVPDDPNVKYYSWGAWYQPGWLDPMRWSHNIIEDVEGKNDGLVSVESAKWGEFRGTLVGCSHVDLVGWVNHVRFTMEAWAGRPIAFKPATFYLEVADHLAKQGF